jgi:hypothetical protein
LLEKIEVVQPGAALHRQKMALCDRKENRGPATYSDFGRDQSPFSLSCRYQFAVSPTCNHGVESAQILKAKGVDDAAAP